MCRIITRLVFLCGIITCLNAAAIDHMTECERSVHTECVINIGSAKEFTEKCQPDKLLECLNKYLKQNICKEKDRDTIPTIDNLITIVRRKFQKYPEICRKKNKFEEFLRQIQDHFTVQGQGIEFTDQRYYEYSGSGEKKAPDDNENGDNEEFSVVKEKSRGENEDGSNSDAANKKTSNSKNDNNKKTDVKGEDGEKKDDGKDINNNLPEKKSKYWQEQSRRIMKGKNDRKVQSLVYFDPVISKKKKSEEENSIPAAIKEAWEELKKRYQRWYLNSKFNKVS